MTAERNPEHQRRLTERFACMQSCVAQGPTHRVVWAEQGPHVSKASPSTPPFAEDRRVRLTISLMLHVGHEGSDGDGHTPRHVAKHRVFGLEVGLDVVAGHRAAGGARCEPVSPDERQLVLDARFEKQQPPGCPEHVAAGEEGDKTPWGSRCRCVATLSNRSLGIESSWAVLRFGKQNASAAHTAACHGLGATSK